MTGPAVPAESAPAVAPLLSVHDLTVSFGGVNAVSGVGFEVGAGQIVGLIGPNGAGKTTTIDAISGFVDHGGRVHLDGRDVSGLPPHERARAGIARTWQSGELFEDLTVGRNCEVATTRVGLGTLVADLVRPRRPSSATAAAVAALDAVGLGHAVNAMPAELPLGTRKLVGVARALAASPRVVLLDEPAAGLDSTESHQLGARLRALVDGGGPAMLLVDHDTDLVFSVCDHVVVLDFGRVIASGGPDVVQVDARVVDAYLGAGGGGGTR